MSNPIIEQAVDAAVAAVESSPEGCAEVLDNGAVADELLARGYICAAGRSGTMAVHTPASYASAVVADEASRIAEAVNAARTSAEAGNNGYGRVPYNRKAQQALTDGGYPCRTNGDGTMTVFTPIGFDAAIEDAGDFRQLRGLGAVA